MDIRNVLCKWIAAALQITVSTVYFACSSCAAFILVARAAVFVIKYSATLYGCSFDLSVKQLACTFELATGSMLLMQ